MAVREANRGTLELVVEDPPERTRRGPTYDFMPSLIVLRDEHPGMWGRIGTWKTAAAATGWRKTLQSDERRRPEGEWEFVSRKLENGRHGLWARYNGS